jgi:hypothetical protein
MERRELTMLKQKGLLVGIEAWRLKMSICRRPGEATNADDEGGSGRPSTIMDGSRRGAAVYALPRETSQLLRCRLST